MWVCMWVGVQGCGLQGYGFCCDNLDYGFYFLDIKKSNPVCLLFIISLNAFDVALMTDAHFAFFIFSNASMPRQYDARGRIVKLQKKGKKQQQKTAQEDEEDTTKNAQEDEMDPSKKQQLKTTISYPNNNKKRTKQWVWN